MLSARFPLLGRVRAVLAHSISVYGRTAMQAASDECGHRGIVLKTSMTRMHRISITTMEHGVLIFKKKKKKVRLHIGTAENTVISQLGLG